jgi:hypothetical protein
MDGYTGGHMYNTIGKKSHELWALVDADGCILWSRGGSSTSPHLMVYDNMKSAERGLRSNWSKQVIDESKVSIQRIYVSGRVQP